MQTSFSVDIDSKILKKISISAEKIKILFREISYISKMDNKTQIKQMYSYKWDKLMWKYSMCHNH